jgi:Rad3-related DNA helicase
VIAKLPFQDTRSAIVKARQEIDKDYGIHAMMQLVVQAVGRGMRSETDWCENLIVDDQWAWVWGKYKAFAPGWFWAAVKKSQTVPQALSFAA